MRRPDAARTQNDLLCGLDLDHLQSCPDLSACATFFAVGLSFYQQLAHLGFVPQLKVGARIAGGAQKRLGRVPAPAIALVHIEVRHPFVAAPVEVVGGRNARLLGSLRKRVQHVPPQALLFDAPFATGVAPAQGVQVAPFGQVGGGQ